MTIVELAALAFPAVASLAIIIIGRLMTRRDLRALARYEDREFQRELREAQLRAADRSQAGASTSTTPPLSWLEPAATDTMFQSVIKSAARDLQRNSVQGRPTMAEAEIEHGRSPESVRRIVEPPAEGEPSRRAK